MSNQKAAKQQEILNELRKYKNEEGIVDISKFRFEKPELYYKISYYFGSVKNATSQLNENENVLNKPIFKNSLCYDILKSLLDKYTYEEIAQLYGVSRVYVHKLFKQLEETNNTSEVKFEISIK